MCAAAGNALGSTTNPLELHDSLRRLAALSGVVRSAIIPALLEDRKQATLAARSFEGAARTMSDIAVLRTLTEESPYAPDLDRAFPASAGAC